MNFTWLTEYGFLVTDVTTNTVVRREELASSRRFNQSTGDSSRSGETCREVTFLEVMWGCRQSKVLPHTDSDFGMVFKDAIQECVEKKLAEDHNNNKINRCLWEDVSYDHHYIPWMMTSRHHQRPSCESEMG